MNQLCKVCGEPAAGFHFGAFTCEGCKSFFGRTYNNLSSLSDCKNNGRCVINKKNRTSCKSCRLRKCLMVGMSKSGSRYGRRSNWFKIHCLLQDQASNISSSESAALLGSHKLLSSSPTSSASYEILRDSNGRHYSSNGLEERTSSASPPGAGGDSSSETETKIGITRNGFHHQSNIYGGMETPSPPYDRREVPSAQITHHHLPMSPVSPVSPHGQFLYNGSSNGIYHNGHSRVKSNRESPRHFLSPYLSVSTYDAMLKTRIVAPKAPSPIRIKKECDDIVAGDCLNQEKPMDLSVRSNSTTPNDRVSPVMTCPEQVELPHCSPQRSVSDAPLDLTRK